MALNYVSLPIEYFPDPTKGRPVFNGSIYVGQPNLDPEIEANRIDVTLRQQDGVEVVIQPASQPLLTGAGGVVIYDGSPVTMLADGNYSLKVLDKQGGQVYYVEDALDGVPISGEQTVLTYENVAEMVADTSLTVGQLARTKGYYDAGDGGGALYLIQVTQAVDGFGDHLLANGNVALLQVSGSVSAKQYGATADGSTDDSPALQAAISAVGGGELYLPTGNYLINTTLSIDTTGLGNTSLFTLVGDGRSNSIIDNQTGGAAIFVTSGVGAEFAYGLTLRGFAITSTGTQAGTIGLQLLGCRFADVDNLLIENMALHGIYADSTIGDLTDTAQIKIQQTEINQCDGYGIFSEVAGNAIQYNWVMDQVRVGNCALGGIYLQSMVNTEITNSGVFYCNGFGLRCDTPVGSPKGKLIRIANTEFDTNEGTQIDIVSANAVQLDQVYLIDNNIPATDFQRGVHIGADCRTVTVTMASPRMNPAVTGKVGIEVDAGAADVVIRDTDYSGFSGTNGDMYVINEPSTTIDDVLNRNRFETGVFTAELMSVDGSKVSTSTVEAAYTLVGNIVTIGFRNMLSLDLSVFIGSDILAIGTMPYRAAVGANSGFAGSCIITTDAASANIPIPTLENTGVRIAFKRATTNAFLLATDLTDGVSEIRSLTITYKTDFG